MILTPHEAEQLALQRDVLHIEEALAHELATWRQRHATIIAELAELDTKIAQGEEDLDQARRALLSGDVAQLLAAQDHLAPRPQLPPDVRPTRASFDNSAPLPEPRRFEPRPASGKTCA